MLVAAVVAGACTARSPARDANATPGGRSRAPACANQERAVDAARRDRRGTLRADVDGDGARDDIWLAHSARARRRCRVLVAADIGPDVLVAPVAVGDGAPTSPLGLPSLRDALQIDARTGAEIVVDVTAGASTVFAAVFTAIEGRIEQIDARGRGAPARDLFAYGGSVAHVHGVDCAAGNVVVVSEAVAVGQRYEVTRTFLRPDGAAWIVQHGRTRSRRVGPQRLVTRFSELGSPPFLGCAAEPRD